MKKVFIIGSILISSLVGFGQQTVKLNINHKLLTQNFNLNQTATNDLGNSFTLTRLQYYLSRFIIIHDGAQETPATGVYALVDASAATEIDLGSYSAITNIEGIKFSVGVNTPQNNQDPTLWPSSHPLSPKSPSMHWGWASGYFFIVYEGMSSPALDQTLGLSGLGNLNYFSQTIATTATTSPAGEQIITINADYAQGLKGIDISGGLVLHGSTGVDAKMIANFRDYVFSAAPITYVGLNENKDVPTTLTIYPNPSSNGIFSVTANDLKNTNLMLTITDVMGRLVTSKKFNASGDNDILIDAKGIYFVSLISEGITVSAQKVIVN